MAIQVDLVEVEWDGDNPHWVKKPFYMDGTNGMNGIAGINGMENEGDGPLELRILSVACAENGCVSAPAAA